MKFEMIILSAFGIRSSFLTSKFVDRYSSFLSDFNIVIPFGQIRNQIPDLSKMRCPGSYVKSKGEAIVIAIRDNIVKPFDTLS